MAQTKKTKSRAPPAPVVPEVPLGKQLAHTDKAVRDAAVRNLSAYLSRGSEEDADPEAEDVAGGKRENGSTFTQLSDAEMAKLWKGLFYCFWMSDKPLIQQALAADLADLILSINPKSEASGAEAEDERDRAALGYLRGFWECICREWQGIDRLRIDKFYLLIRRFVNATFRLLQRSGWKAENVQLVNRILQGSPAEGKQKARAGPLDYTNPRIPISLSTHLSDLYMTELDRVLSSPSSSSTPCPLISLLEPFTTLVARTPSPVVYTRLMDTMFLPLLRALTAAAAAITSTAAVEGPTGKKRRTNNGTGTTAGAAAETIEGVEGYANIVAHSEPSGAAGQKAAVLQSLFSAAADEKAKEANRRKVYIVWNEMGGADHDAEEDW